MPQKAKGIKDIRSLARLHTDKAIATLAGIMNQPKAQASARIAAATVLLDRGWGKAPQPMTGADGEGPITVERIERFIIQADEQLQIGSGKGNGAVEAPGEEADGAESEAEELVKVRPTLVED